MWSRFIIDAEAWSGADIAWNPGLETATTPAAVDYTFTAAFAAIRRSDVSAARDWQRRFETARAAQRGKTTEADPETVEYRSGLDVLSLELEGLLQLAAGDEGGLASLRRATAVEDGKAYAFGPPEVNKPSHELLGEELARLNRPAEAEAEFRAALQRTPGRVTALRGLSRALASQSRSAPADSVAMLLPH
jgi:soluble cytochrome b562